MELLIFLRGKKQGDVLEFTQRFLVLTSMKLKINIIAVEDEAHTC